MIETSVHCTAQIGRHSVVFSRTNAVAFTGGGISFFRERTNFHRTVTVENRNSVRCNIFDR
jgi:hypothetical protein